MAVDLATRSAIDDVFDDNFSIFDDDVFDDKPTSKSTHNAKPDLSPRSSMKRKADEINDKENLGLGLDEEVKIVKKRQPVAKLDEARLLSTPGLPVLRKLIREKQIKRKLRLKGKGHEFTDAARLLNYYQLWLDNLYPRAKFADALQLVEKAGHTKRMQMTRSEWINEGKPGYIRPELINVDMEVRPDEMPDLFTNNNADGHANRPETTDNNNVQATGSIFGNGLTDDSLFLPDGDEPVATKIIPENEPDDDELYALLAMQDDYDLPKQPERPTSNANDSEGDDDLDALLAEQDARQNVHSDIPLILNSDAVSSDGVAEVDVDDLDALLASQETRQARLDEAGKDYSQTHSIPADLDDDDAVDEFDKTPSNSQSGAGVKTIVAEGLDSQLRELDED